MTASRRIGEVLSTQYLVFSKIGFTDNYWLLLHCLHAGLNKHSMPITEILVFNVQWLSADGVP